MISAPKTDIIRLEEYQGLIQNKLLAVWQQQDAASPWLPTEFMLAQYITRILVTGRSSPISFAMASDPSWTQVWRSPGGKEWSCLLGLLPHMPGPVLIVVGPDIALTPKLIAGLHAAAHSPSQSVLISILRTVGGAGWAGEMRPDHTFFPVLDGPKGALMGDCPLDLKTVLPQLAAQGYALSVVDGTWFWYKPADSPPLVTLTQRQIAQQLFSLGQILERAA